MITLDLRPSSELPYLLEDWLIAEFCRRPATTLFIVEHRRTRSRFRQDRDT